MNHSLLSDRDTIRLDRRRFMALSAALVAAGTLPGSALARSTPRPFKLGSMDVAVVSDGTLVLPASIIAPEAKLEDVLSLLGAEAKDGQFTAQENVLFIRTGRDNILIDTGSGTGYQDSAGQLGESLGILGVAPADITKVLYTHLHPDHLWGTIAAGKPVFANATFHIAEAEYNFWADPDLATKMPKDFVPVVGRTQDILARIKDRVSTFKPNDEIVSGIAAIATPGHTPGHVSFELAGGDGLLVVGDVIVNTSVFLAHPEWRMGFDADGATAEKSRRQLLDHAASKKSALIGYHWPYPGTGRVEKSGGTYRFVPSA